MRNNFKSNVAYWLPGIIFTFIGGVFLVVGLIITMYNYQFRSNGVEDTAVITKIESFEGRENKRDYRVYIKYIVDGKEYNQYLGFYNINMYEGKEIQIYYDPEDPRRVKAKDEIFVWFIFPSIGFLFFVIGLIMIINRVRRVRLNKELLESGQKIYAEFVEVRLNSSYSVNGRHPFCLICRWTDENTGKVHLFKSEHLWEDPSYLIQERNINSFSVYIDKYNPNNYVVSLEELSDSYLLGERYEEYSNNM